MDAFRLKILLGHLPIKSLNPERSSILLLKWDPLKPDKNCMRMLYLLSFLFISQSWAEPCGILGTVQERIKNCNSTKGNFVLVTRDEKGLEIYKDLKSNLIWGDRMTTDFNHYGSQMACNHDLPEAGLLKDVHWRLPTVHEFEASAAHGMKAALPHMDHGFWTSTPFKSRTKSRRRSRNSGLVFLWDGLEEHSETADLLKDAASVRCIGKDTR